MRYLGQVLQELWSEEPVREHHDRRRQRRSGVAPVRRRPRPRRDTSG
ncbi:hypothetical protein [Nocardioides euryhalodurans]|nr:hypothetical protein [Nocardioides euryhalodurans]